MPDLTLKFPKDKVIETLVANRAKHRADFIEAHDAYRETVVKQLHERLDAAKSGKPVMLHFNLPEPKDQTKDYDRAISMLGLCIETEIALSEDQYANLMLDDWSWSRATKETYSNYTGKRYG